MSTDPNGQATSSELRSEASPSDPVPEPANPDSPSAVPETEEPGSFEEFDLSPFREQLRAERRIGTRMLAVIGIVVTIAGVAAASFVSVSAGFSWILLIGIIAIFAVVGFAPLLWAFVPSREWRYPRTLRVEASGFRVIDSGGGVQKFRWDDPALVVSVRERLGPDGGSGTPDGAERLVVVPYAMCLIPAAAREYLLIEAAANGLTVVEDRFDEPDGAGMGAPVPSVTRTAMRRYVPELSEEPPTEPAPVGDGASELPLPRKLPPHPDRAYDGPSNNPLRAIRFSENGFSIISNDGRVRTYEWTDTRWRATMYRNLENPLERVVEPTAIWRLQLSGPNAFGGLDGRSYGMLMSASRNAGREIASARMPSPAPPHSFWIAETSIRPPPGSGAR